MEISTDQLIEIFSENSEIDISNVEFEDSMTLEELGIDSMGMVSMAFAIEDLVGLTVEDDALGTLKTLADVRTLLTENGVTITD